MTSTISDRTDKPSDEEQVPTAEQVRRRELIQGLHDLADWLEANPDVPLSAYPSAMVAYYPSNDGFGDEAGIALIGDLAERFGGTPQVLGGTHYYADRSFGPASYSACYIVAERREAVRPPLPGDETTTGGAE